MKNMLNYRDFNVKKPNMINLQKTLFSRDMKRRQKPTVRLNNQLSNTVIENVKTHLAKDEYREMLRDSFGDDSKKSELRTIIHNYVSNKDFLENFSSLITDYDFDELSDILVEKIAGLDVLQPLAEIETITDIKVIAFNNIWADDINLGKYKTDIQFESEKDYLELCQRFAFASNKPYSVAKPSVDAVFPYMRVNFVGQDLSPRLSLQVRKISKKLRYDEPYMLETNYASQLLIDLLKKTFASESHLISGATGTGKTEVLRYFAKYTKPKADIIMIEDTPETYLDELYPEKPIQMWRNRESNDDDKKAFGYSYHIRNAMRQNPDYIFIQESRGEESYDVLDAALTGHITNTTLHAANVLDAVSRFIYLCQKAQNHPDSYYGQAITRAFPIGIHIKRIGNKRVVNQVAEYRGYEDGKVLTNILIQFNDETKTHEQVGKLSEKTWDRMLEVQLNSCDSDLSTIEALSPYKS